MRGYCLKESYLSRYFVRRYPGIMKDFVDDLIESWQAVRPDLDTTPLEAIARILRAAQIIQPQLDTVIASEPELSHKGDLDTLTAVRRAGSDEALSPTTLAQVGQLTSGGMTNRLDRLEAAGLIVRRPNPADRRSVLVSLTAKGEALADDAFAASLETQRRLLERLSRAQQRAIAEAVRPLLVAMGDEPVPSPSASLVGHES